MTEITIIRPCKLHRIAIVVAALALGSAVITTDAVAAVRHAGGGGGVIAGDRVDGGFGARGFEHDRYGRRGYYPCRVL